MKKFISSVLLILFTFVFSACTYSITMAHTEGSATDLIDEVATNTPTVSPTVTVPMSAI